MLALEETIDLMLSGDYKERFKAEYWQLKYRSVKLKDIVVKWEAWNDYKRVNHIDETTYYLKPSEKTIKDFLGFTPTCSFELLSLQLGSMLSYLHSLEVRAEIEKINLLEDNLQVV